jgi:hypothetical protein
LGRANNCNNAIIEFFPLPRHDHKAWFPFMNVDNTDIGCRKSYLKNMLTENRKNLINQMFNNSDLQVLVVHGSLNKNSLKRNYDKIIEALDLKHFKDHSLGIRGEKVITEIYTKEYRKENSNVKVFFTPFLGNGAITEEALQKLIKIIRD